MRPTALKVVLEAVARARLDDHPGAVGPQRLPDVRGRALRIAHVVQAVEERDEVVVLAREVLRRRDDEADAVGHASRSAARRAYSTLASW